MGFDGDDRAYVLDEFYLSRAQDGELITATQELVKDYGVGPLVCARSEPGMVNKFILVGLKAKAWKRKRDDSIRDIRSAR